ncbi:MAG: hypothetical protein WCC48_09670, partial [Anaeromyxobacteraceae bacterium]
MLVAGVLVVATFRDFGSVWDDRYQRAVGQAAVAWWSSAGADARALEGGETGNLNLYGGLFEGIEEAAAARLPFDPLESRHLVNAFLALAGVAGTALLARRLGGARAAFFSAALLLATPPWWGHGFANSKDIPFAAAFPWMLLAVMRTADELPRPGLRRILAAGLALGCCLAARPGGLIIVLPLAAGVTGVRAFRLLFEGGGWRGRATAAVAIQFAAVVAIAWMTMLLGWPYGLTHPISGPLEAVAAARSHPWEGLVRFDGAWVSSVALPRSYAPIWFAATLPETWFSIAAAGVAAFAVAVRRGRLRSAWDPVWLDRGLVAVAGVGPVLAAVATRPVLYDGIRHLLFVLPSFAALAGWSLSASLDLLPRPGRWAALTVTAGLAALAIVDSVRLHPYEYVYFNRLIAGGLPGASRDFELDYWGAAGREAMAWVVRNVPPRPGGPRFVTSTVVSDVAAHWIVRDPSLTSRFVFDVAGPPDMMLASTRWFEHRSTGKVLHVVSRMGVPLLYVLDRSPEAAAPIVLEAGDLAVSLPASSGWMGAPRIEQGDERAAYLLRREHGTPAQVEGWVVTQRSGQIPDGDALRGEVARIAGRVLGVDPG